MARHYKPTGNPRGRPPLTPEQRAARSAQARAAARVGLAKRVRAAADPKVRRKAVQTQAAKALEGGRQKGTMTPIPAATAVISAVTLDHSERLVALVDMALTTLELAFEEARQAFVESREAREGGKPLIGRRATANHKKQAMGSQAALGVLSTQIRVDEAALRRRQGDFMSELLKRIDETKIIPAEAVTLATED